MDRVSTHSSIALSSTRRPGILLQCVVILFLFMGSLQGLEGCSAEAKGQVPAKVNPNRPVLAFYYQWYRTSDWCRCHMSDLPTIPYQSSSSETIDRQLQWAQSSGITGFIASWWGIHDQTDTNFAALLQHAGALQKKTGVNFNSTLYVESDSPNLNTTEKMIAGLRYLMERYSANSRFFHWQGKPVLFFWNPLGNGRTLATWSYIRSKVDPHHSIIWSAEGINMSLLNVFDGIHLFSAGYWGLLNNTMPSVDKSFHDQIAAYNKKHHTHKIWAAGVMPGYDDTRVPGRKGAFKVPRSNGATYRTSWTAAIGSNPDWVTITSFNEWYEGAQIEPGTHYGTLYLSMTKQYATKWHG